MSIWGDINRRSQGHNLKKEDIIFKELIYGKDQELEIIVHNIYHGVEYYVVNYGHYPAAYVVCDVEFLARRYEPGDTLDAISIHGGVTYVGPMCKLKAFPWMPENKFCFGWNYDHASDWNGNLSQFLNQLQLKHFYTTEMIVADCKSAIDQYLGLKRHDEVFRAQICPTLEEKA